jgi:transposase
MAEAGLFVDSKTLYNLTTYVATKLAPIAEMIKEEIKSRPMVGIDETPLRLTGNGTKGYIWAICNNYGVYYQYETTRSGSIAKELLEGFSGHVMCDGYAGYRWIRDKKSMTLNACWSHVRRKFYDAVDEYQPAQKVVDRIDDLFDIEHEAKTLEETKKIRGKKSHAALKAIDIRVSKASGKVLETSAMGKAIFYYNSMRPHLSHFLQDPAIPLSNNACESNLRSPVLGRKNFQGFRSIDGADTGMVCYTLVNSCKVMRISSKSFITEMMSRASSGKTLETPLQYVDRIRQQAIENKDLDNKLGELAEEVTLQ